MSRAKRGGTTIKSGKIGRVNCIRQQIMMPGERMNMRVSGKVKLETLRERETMRINAHLAFFMTPLRWLWPEFTDYVKEGPNTAISPPTHSHNSLSDYGIGSTDSTVTAPNVFNFWRDACHRVYNEWYKWPEDTDLVPGTDAYGTDGPKAVPLAKPWSRARFKRDSGDTADYEVASNTSFDIRALASAQARYRQMMKRDVLSFGRWMELINEQYKGDGSREVDQVPIMLDQVDVGVNPREIPATDGASLGQWQSMYDFNVDHTVRGIVAPEHCIITCMLTVRFASVIEGIHPLAADHAGWFNLTADPEWHSNEAPVALRVYETQMDSGNSTVLGYLPAGWQWKCEHDVIGNRIDELDSFPYMRRPSTQDEAKDATRIKNAFRSTRLGDYVADLYFSEDSRQPIGTAMDSYFAGMVDEARMQSNNSQEFPKGGKQL